MSAMLRIADAAWTDCRQAVRRLLRSPWLSLMVIVALTPAIAASTTIFSLLKVTVLQQLHVPNPGALVSIEGSDTRTSNYSGIFLPTLRLLKETPGSFASMAAYLTSASRLETDSANISTGVEGVTPEYFAVLGVQPMSGRLIRDSDDPLAPIAVMSARLAVRVFGTTDVAGRLVTVDGRTVEIIGVTERGFTGVRMDGGDDLFLPAAFLRFMQTADAKAVPRVQQIIGRLAPSATVDTARAEVLARWPAIQAAVAAELPTAQRVFVENQRLTIESFARGFSGTRLTYGRALNLAMALALVMLAIGCVNLTALMLARSLARQHEFAVKRALGVSRLRLFQQSAIDGVLLSLAAALVAMPIAWWASGVLVSIVSVAKAVPIGNAAPDWPVMLAATGVSLLCGLAISVLPARRALSVDPDAVLRGRGASHRLRGTARLVLSVQVALSLILVVGAGLFTATLSNLYGNDLQERAGEVIWTRLARNPVERATMLEQPYFEDLAARLAAIPGADAAAYSTFYPAYLSYANTVPRDTVSVAGIETTALTDFVSPGFFELYSIKQLRGRDFTWHDNTAAPPVAIVNETLARKLAPSGEIIGQQVRVTAGPATTAVEIVGVVADANITHIRDGRTAGLYRPLMQDMRSAQFPLAHVRVRGDLGAAQRGYVDAVNERRHHAVLGLFTIDAWLDNALVEQRLTAGLSTFAAALAVTLCAVGLFGLLAYSVSSRSREIGVRVSIGAKQGEVIRMIVLEGLLAALPGVVIGIPLALAVAWALRARFYGVAVTDARVIIAAVVVLIATAAIASWLPARRASRIQPIEALRQE